MNWRLVGTLLVFALLITPLGTVQGQGLDQYGGYQDLPVSGGATGHFRTAKVGNRWVFVTPEGNTFWTVGIYCVDVDDHVDDRGGTYRQRVIAKYGDADLRWAPQQNRRLKAWGFNTLGEYSSGYTLPWATINDPRWPGGVQPVKLPAIPFPLQAAWYSQTNVLSYASGPVKELYRGLDGHFTGYRGQFPDVFDPNFDQWVNGRVASSEYARAAASPWLLGIGSDDTDYLTGFGPGPEFDSGGHTHPHLGYVALLTPSTQDANPARSVTYTDTKVYTKYALRDFLQAKYGTIGALNAAWGASYTTFDADGGWPNGRGLLDENGKGPWVGTDSSGLTNAAAAVRTDLDAFLYDIAKRYFSVYRTRIKQYYPNVLYLGPTTIGGWGAPPRREVLQAAGQYLDVIRTTYDGGQPQLDFFAAHAGDKPLMTWLGGVGNPDSALFRYANGGQSDMFTSQADRGAYYQGALRILLNATAGPTGAQPFVGFEWWDFQDSWGEKANWGIVTLSDNAYDGREATIASGTDPWGYSTGGEEGNYGNFLGTVAAANAQIALTLGGPSPPPTDPVPTTTTISAPTVTYNANAVVTVVVAAATGTPTGTVTLAIDSGSPLTGALSNGQAQFTLTSPSAGDHSLSATYAAQGTFAASSANGALDVNAATDSSPLSFRSATYTVGESQASVRIHVLRGGAAIGTVRVQYGTSDGSARAGVDYRPTSGTLSFGPRVTSQWFAIPISDNKIAEGPRTVNLTLSNATVGALLGTQSTSVLTIVNDDVPGSVQFATTNYIVGERGAIATIWVTRVGGSSGGVTVTYTTSDGTARAGLDYKATSGNLIFGPGQTRQSFSIPIIMDNLKEPTETVVLTLSQPGGGATLGSPTAAVLKIRKR